MELTDTKRIAIWAQHTTSKGRLYGEVPPEEESDDFIIFEGNAHDIIQKVRDIHAAAQNREYGAGTDLFMLAVARSLLDAAERYWTREILANV